MKGLLKYFCLVGYIILGGLLGVLITLVFAQIARRLDITIYIYHFFLSVFVCILIAGAIWVLRFRHEMKCKSLEELSTRLQDMPANAKSFILSMAAAIGYKKYIRREVADELACHFEEILGECKTDEERITQAQKTIEDFGDAKVLGKLIRRAKKRCRPMWRIMAVRTLQATGVLTLCLILYVVWFLMGKPSITVDYVAELNRVVRPVADDQQNAAPYYGKASELFVPIANDARKILRRVGKVPWQEFKSKEREIIEKWLSDNEEALGQVVLGSRKPYYWQRYESESGEMLAVLMPSLSEIKNLCRCLCWRARFRAEEERLEDAIEDTLACYQVGEHFSGEKTLTEQLVGIAIENAAFHTAVLILYEHQIDSQMLEEFQTKFEKLIANKDFIINFEIEKLTMYDEIQRCFTGERLGGLYEGGLYVKRLARISGLTGYDGLGVLTAEKGWITLPYLLFAHPSKKESREMGDRFWNFWEKKARKSPAQIRAENIDFDKKAQELIRGNVLLGTLIPNIRGINRIAYRNKAEVQALITIIALLRYEKVKGTYPENLDELITAGYLNKLPMDPYSDKPLVYKRVNDDFTLYSLGADFDDDGGVPSKWGEYDEGGDQVFWPVQWRKK